MTLRLPLEISVLGRLEWRRCLAFWRGASRDLVFDFAVFVGLALGWAVLRRVWHVSHGQPTWLLTTLAIGFGAVLCWQVHAGSGSKVRQDLLTGPFHSLVIVPAAMTRWIAVRDVVLCAALILPMSLVWCGFNLLFGLGFLCFSVSGAAVVGLAGALWPSRASRRGAAVERGVAPRPAQHWPAPLMIVVSSQRRGPVPPWLVALALTGVTALAGTLAARNNGSVAIGQYISAVGAFLAGALMLPSGRLPGMLGQQPLGFPRLFGWLYASPLCLAGVCGFVGGLIVGPGLIGAFQTASIAVVGLFILAWMHFLTRLIRSERNTGLSTALEFAGALMMSAVETSLAPLYILGRAAILVRAAQRRRWLDR